MREFMDRAGNRATGDREGRKKDVLAQSIPSSVRSIADAVVLEAEGVFLVTTSSGSIPFEEEHGLGLYYHDCRFLSGYVLRVGGALPDGLAATSAAGIKGTFQLTNPALRLPGGRRLEKHELGIRWERLLDGAARTLHDVIALHNYAGEPVEVDVDLAFRGGFEDVYVVRGLMSEKPGTLRTPVWEGGLLCFSYDGGDGLTRAATIRPFQAPDETGDTQVRFRLSIPPGEEREVALSITLSETTDSAPASAAVPAEPAPQDREAVERLLDQRRSEWRSRPARVVTENLVLGRVLDRAVRDLAVLRTTLGEEPFFAAGIPWYGTLFGRDSLITALFVLAYEQGAAADTLRLLARHQGRAYDAWREEEPGKILHEYRVGELARLGLIPHTPYYGTVDATALFLILLARHAAWTGGLELFHELRGNVEAALAWMSSADRPRVKGYLAYRSSSGGARLVNQGWKDSGDAIVMDDGSLARSPIALVEVQGYVYLARILVATLFDRAGEPETAARLRSEAGELAARFDRDFWVPGEGYHAMALVDAGRPSRVLSSNAGQALWSGIAPPDKAERVARAMMSDAMWTGWGVRTLSAREQGYNPVSYHRGTVWPHDSAMIAAGFKHYSLDADALRVFSGLVEAAMRFPSYRLPELFCGFSREEYEVPVSYPVACHPQAWATGAIPYLLGVLLGLEPDGFERRLRVVRPVLPSFVDDLTLSGITVAGRRVDLRFSRQPAGNARVEVVSAENGIEVLVEECP